MARPSAYSLPVAVRTAIFPTLSVHIGDSHTYGNDNPPVAYPIKFSELSGSPAIVAAFNGRGTQACIDHYNAEVVPNMPFLPNFSAFATLLIGENDLSQDITAAQIYALQTDLADCLHAQRFYTCNMLLPVNGWGPGTPQYTKRLELEALVRANSAGFGFVFDTIALNPEVIGGDNYHWSSAGHLTVATALLAQAKLVNGWTQ